MRIAHNLVIDHFRKKSRIPKFNNNKEFDIFSIIKDNSADIETALIKKQTLKVRK